MEVEVRGLWKGLDGTVYGYCICGREVNNKDNFRSDGSVKELEEEDNGSAKEAIKKSRDGFLKCPMCKATLIWPDFDKNRYNFWPFLWTLFCPCPLLF